jgi:hypothetical protein
MQAMQIFPNVHVLKLKQCCIPLATILPLIQRQPPLSLLSLSGTKLCRLKEQGQGSHSWPFEAFFSPWLAVGMQR